MAKLNQAGRDLIKSFEACRFLAYPDPGTGGKPWTIGWGHTGPEVKPGLFWSERKCEEVFQKDCDNVVRQINVYLGLPENINENQFAAMVSFAYNLGIDDLQHVIETVGIAGFPEKIQEYVHAGPPGKKKVLKGLLIRQRKEAELFNTPVGGPKC